MSVLPRKGLLAIAAVVDVAMHSSGRPVSAKSLAERHRLPARHLEPVLQALVHNGILKGTRGPRGGYELAREQRRISAGEILLAVGTLDDGFEDILPESQVVRDAVLPVLAKAERAFIEALRTISIHDMAREIQHDGRSALSLRA